MPCLGCDRRQGGTEPPNFKKMVKAVVVFHLYILIKLKFGTAHHSVILACPPSFPFLSLPSPSCHPFPLPLSPVFPLPFHPLFVPFCFLILSLLPYSSLPFPFHPLSFPSFPFPLPFFSLLLLLPSVMFPHSPVSFLLCFAIFISAK